MSRHIRPMAPPGEADEAPAQEEPKPDVGALIDRLRAAIRESGSEEAQVDFETLCAQLNEVHNTVLLLTGWKEGAKDALSLACGAPSDQG